MSATREQLLARWETPEGQQLAEKVLRELNPIDSGSIAPRSIKSLDAALLTQVALLPFADEVTPSIDLRGLHRGKEGQKISLMNLDLSQIRLDYAYEISRIIKCQTDGVILDGSHSRNGMFMNSTLTGISFVKASLNGGFFDHSNLSSSHLQGASLINADLSYTRCHGTLFTGADLRFADFRYADLSGADLREADLTEGSFYAVTFDQQTRLQGANFDGANLSPDLRAFAERSGAILTPHETTNRKMMIEMEVTARALQRMNHDGRYDDAIVAVNEARELFRQHPDYNYGDGLEEAFAHFGSPPPWKDEVLEIWDETSRGLAHYL